MELIINGIWVLVFCICIVIVVMVMWSIKLLRHIHLVVQLMADQDWWLILDISECTGIKMSEVNLIIEALAKKGYIEERLHEKSFGQKFLDDYDFLDKEMIPEIFFKWDLVEYRLKIPGGRKKRFFLDWDFASPLPSFG